MRTIGGKVVSGVGWTFVATALARLVQLVVTIALARMLAPADFGHFALLLMVVNAVALFRDYGLSQSLIYQKGEISGYAHSTFIMSGVYGIAAWLIIFAVAPLLDFIFTSADLVLPLRVMSISLLFSSLVMVPAALLEKELEFRKRALPEFANPVCYAAVAIILAHAGYGVWSLIAGHIVGTAVGSATIWLVAPYRPRIRFSGKCAKTSLSYGRHLMFASVAIFAFFYIDHALIGHFLGVAPLGLYSLAFTVCNLPATNLTHVVNRVMFPAYTILNDDIQAMRNAYLNVLTLISLVSFPLALGIAAAAPDFVHAFFKPRWHPAIPLFQILAFYGLFRSVGATVGSIFMASGQPKWVYRTNGLMLVIALPLVYPVTAAYGVKGVAILFTLSYAIGMSAALNKTASILKMGWRGYASALKSTFAASLLSVGLAYLLVSILELASILRLAVFAVLMIPLYCATIYLLDRNVIQLLRSAKQHVNSSAPLPAAGNS